MWHIEVCSFLFNMRFLYKVNLYREKKGSEKIEFDFPPCPCFGLTSLAGPLNYLKTTVVYNVMNRCAVLLESRKDSVSRLLTNPCIFRT